MANRANKRIAVFQHANLSEYGPEGAALSDLFLRSRVSFVEMGHTHYNEPANDGHIVYATTGQVEEGPPGLSVTTIDNGSVSWKFKPITEWPFVMITSPADRQPIRSSIDSENALGAWPEKHILGTRLEPNKNHWQSKRTHSQVPK